MKVLVLGLDQTILKKTSLSFQRAEIYKKVLDKYFVLVPAASTEQVVISEGLQFFGFGGFLKIMKLVKIFFGAKKILQEEKFDVISTQDVYFLGFVGLILARLFSIGLEIQVHGWEKKGWGRLSLARFILKRANAIRVVSQRLKKELIEKFGVQEEKIIVAPIFVQLNEDKVIRVEKPANQSFIFLTVGRLVRVKNIEMQIRTLAQLGNRNWGLWIVGDGSEKNALSNLAYKLGVAEKIKFFGQQDHSSLFRLYQLADCFLLTSLEEGWGLAVAEAAYFGLPIIMTDVGCAGEFIKDNYNGRVIKPGDHADLLKVVEEIIRDKDLSLRLGENAKQSFKDLPNQEVVLELYLKSWKKARL